VISNDARAEVWLSGSGIRFHIQPKTILAMVDFAHSQIAKTAVQKEYAFSIENCVVSDPCIADVSSLMLHSGGVNRWKAISRNCDSTAVDGRRSGWPEFKFCGKFLFGHRKANSGSRYIDQIKSGFFARIGKIDQYIDWLSSYQFAIETSANRSDPRTLIGSHLSQLIYQNYGLDSQNGGGYRSNNNQPARPLSDNRSPASYLIIGVVFILFGLIVAGYAGGYGPGDKYDRRHT